MIDIVVCIFLIPTVYLLFVNNILHSFLCMKITVIQFIVICDLLKTRGGLFTGEL